MGERPLLQLVGCENIIERGLHPQYAYFTVLGPGQREWWYESFRRERIRRGGISRRAIDRFLEESEALDSGS